MNFLTVRLCTSDHTNTFDLKYRLLDNSFVPKWVERYQYSQSRGDDISTRDQFYGLNDSWTADKVMATINQKVDDINRLVPGLIDRKLHRTDDQDTLNYLHAFFEKYHGKIDQWLTDPWWQDKPKSLRSIWSDLNNYIHRLEGYRNVAPLPRIKVCWYDTPKTQKFSEEDYGLFEAGYRFGVMYALYSDVGKDLLSLAKDNDDHHHDFVPYTYYSADFHLRFHTDDADTISDKINACDRYYKRNENYFLSKGYERHDPRLAIGSIPIAELSNPQSESEIMSTLGSFDRIQGVYLY